MPSYSKEEQLRGHQKPKDKPKYKERKPKKKKNPYLHRGRIIPSRRERTKITKANYLKMVEVFGEYCQECGHTPIEAHHLVFRSQMGSGNWRNLAPLCQRCHKQAHRDREFADYLREKRAAEYSEHFAKDVYTLFQERLVNNTTKETYEKFMQNEQRRAQGGNMQD